MYQDQSARLVRFDQINTGPSWCMSLVRFDQLNTVPSWCMSLVWFDQLNKVPSQHVPLVQFDKLRPAPASVCHWSGSYVGVADLLVSSSCRLLKV